MSKLVHTYRTESFGGTIIIDPKTNRRKLQLASPSWYQTVLADFKEGTKVSLHITSKRGKRTIAQNRYYWGVYLPEIMKETGERDIHALHTLFKGKFLAKEVKEVLGQKVRITGSTTDLSVSEFCEYILAIEEMTGVQAPPTENWELAPLREQHAPDPAES